MQNLRNGRRSSYFSLGMRWRGIYRHFEETIGIPLLAAYKNAASRSSLRLLLLAVCLFVGMLIFTRLFDITVSPTANSYEKATVLEKIQKKINIPLNCSMGNLTKTCPDNYYPKGFIMHDQEHISVPQHMCPEFFRWIHEDLKPWAKTGITKEMVERARKPATFRLVILNGRAYVEKYKKTIQTRDVFTIWGFLQLLRRYPGKVPDLDLMFDCLDYPVIRKKDYHKLNSTFAPPPLFRYCSDDYSWDIVFPDWSFWGWQVFPIFHLKLPEAEISIKPWESLLKDLDLGNKRTKWIDREPYAYWKGNPWVAEHRRDLLKCNLSETQDWNARLYVQDWNQEAQEGFKQSHLANQCTHRFKIYIEGSAWSVSEKYILACDSMTLLVTPNYYDFFTRGLMPIHHYWPVKMDDKCRSIKFAVEWGNNHEQKVNEIGRAASNFIQEDLKMDNVYDYMFHLLSGYSRLMKYKPTVPQNAVEICSETMACTSEGLAKQFMEESTVKGPADVTPCIMQPPYDPQTLNTIHDRKMNSIQEVEKWEKD